MQKKQSQKTSSPTDEEDLDLFRQAVKDVKPLQHDKVTHQKAKPGKSRSDRKTEKQEVIDILSDEAEVRQVQPTEVLSYCQTGIQKRAFKKLRRGQYTIIEELDLHGLTAQKAKKLLLHFLEVALQIEGSCAIVVHGKGHRSGDKEPVLKRQTNHWLRQHPRVLAFHSAQPKDGGTGAVYVLLRRTQFIEHD